ncbi:glycosyltransferase [Calothrix membranacea FACHB-236]|nr:glycosyltransferase [Calothrix membranacea FACHB-236]
MLDYPRITLVTPSYNQSQFLEATIKSVLSQNYPNLEYIIIDGGSTDTSVNIIRSYADQLTYWVSEPDQGQSDAIAKGFARVTGDIINWLNSDDLLLPNALFAVAQAYQETQADLIVGEDLHFRGNNIDQPVYHFRPANYHYPECWQFWTEEFRYHQPCTFFSRKAYHQVAGLNRDLHYVMDYDLYCRILALPDTKVFYLNHPLSAFRLHDNAKTAKYKPKFLREKCQIISHHSQEISLTQEDKLKLNSYVAQCNFHNAVDASRKQDWITALQSLLDGYKVAPGYFCQYALKRMSRI